MKYCSRCIYDTTVPGIYFDENGVCNYCHQVDNLVSKFGTETDFGLRRFEKILDGIKKSGRGKKYDCVIGVSGGADSSMLLHLAVREWGLRPLAVHYDNTWNSSHATMNIAAMLSELNIDLYTHVVNNKEVDDIFKSFFRAGVAEIEASTDLAYAYLIRKVAHKHGIKYVLEGHSFLEEGVTPLGRNYFDGKYIKEIHKSFGELPLETYPLMTLNRFLYISLIARVQIIRPFWYIKYQKAQGRDFLSSNYNWKYYGGHHLENKMTAFYHKIYTPYKFGVDMRNNTLSAVARRFPDKRQACIDEYTTVPEYDRDLEFYFRSRLDISESEFRSVMAESPRDWTEFPNYKKTFERLRPLFYVLASLNLVPYSFYIKYCK